MNASLKISFISKILILSPNFFVIDCAIDFFPDKALPIIHNLIG